jgi:bifunctional non-homologous end joining protein LigD
MKLKDYQSKRNFEESPEPTPKVSKRGKALQFVVQKHDASHLHYDFRLEVDGVLKSWAVPKGPSLDPSVKHLSMMVEDHPFDYREFEGVIPSGYGAGIVMIWDQGTYSVKGESAKKSEDLMREGLQKGSIHFTLEGTKLKGEFALVRLKKGDKDNEWLLIKIKDEYCTKEDILNEDRSVVSGKKLQEIGLKKKVKKSET